ncbi:hypothetical protein Rsub_12778 [Raphidocelis subcapitata]|uniref:Uncharacterized protein n=1 Tax=Raphidocelis subcapitata TaxID=307507 RepID=A0A2V0PPU7_9CHLO|nr:hypothetical protein Rsub_12778 [Raphidocelis subcapitata]|eukprot:GBG00081.1 hypothetical protein Rsub_12778 [Raphidocelis subcapitata]
MSAAQAQGSLDEEERASEAADSVSEAIAPPPRASRAILKAQQQPPAGKQQSGSAESLGERSRRTVSWTDFAGSSLAAVREFEPSEPSEGELHYNSRRQPSCCVIS